jgi:hypothetical protein
VINIDELRLQIEALLRDYPDLEEDEMLRRDMLDAETDISGVLTALLQASSNNKYMIDAINNRIDQLAARRARFKHRVEFLRNLILKVLQSADLKRFELPEATLSQRASQPQLIGEVDVTLLPDELCRVTREPDRVKIREALLKGDTVPGMFLSNAPPTLSVSTR